MLPPCDEMLHKYRKGDWYWKWVCWLVGHKPHIIGGRGGVWQACKRCTELVPLWPDPALNRPTFFRIDA